MVHDPDGRELLRVGRGEDGEAPERFHANGIFEVLSVLKREQIVELSICAIFCRWSILA
jgi:hypothetical protein